MNLLDLAAEIPGDGRDPLGLGFAMDCDWREVCQYESSEPGGQLVIASVYRIPAAFWRLSVPSQGIVFDFGDGLHLEVEEIAKAIASGREESVSELIARLEGDDMLTRTRG
jgi:hypothetical protein